MRGCDRILFISFSCLCIVRNSTVFGFLLPEEWLLDETVDQGLWLPLHLGSGSEADVGSLGTPGVGREMLQPIRQAYYRFRILQHPVSGFIYWFRLSPRPQKKWNTHIEIDTSVGLPLIFIEFSSFSSFGYISSSFFI